MSDHEADRQRILAAIQTLDQFAAGTPLPRDWHAQWQFRFQQVAASIDAVLKKAPEADKVHDEDQPDPPS